MSLYLNPNTRKRVSHVKCLLLTPGMYVENNIVRLRHSVRYMHLVLTFFLCARCCRSTSDTVLLGKVRYASVGCTLKYVYYEFCYCFVRDICTAAFKERYIAYHKLRVCMYA